MLTAVYNELRVSTWEEGVKHTDQEDAGLECPTESLEQQLYLAQAVYRPLWSFKPGHAAWASPCAFAAPPWDSGFKEPPIHALALHADNGQRKAW